MTTETKLEVKHEGWCRHYTAADLSPGCDCGAIIIDELEKKLAAMETERNGLLTRVVEVENQVSGLAKMRAEQDGKLVELRREADAADAMWRERLRVAEEQVAESVLREGEAVRMVDELKAHMRVMMDVHCHQPGPECGVCEFARAFVEHQFPRAPEPKPDAALPYTLEGT